MLARAKAIIEKGPRVIGYRTLQSARLSVWHTGNLWRRLHCRTRKLWTQAESERWRQRVLDEQTLIGPSHLRAFRNWAAKQDIWAREVFRWADRIQSGEAPLFDEWHAVNWEEPPWHSDWRFKHTWSPQYFKEYRFYANAKDKPFDVKFPWELSRFLFLYPVVQAALLREDWNSISWVAALVERWESQNPIAESIAWDSMECSMRGIAFALLVQMLASEPRVQSASLLPFLRQLSLHGEFLWRNIEYTDVRGNHYAANLTALLLIGSTLAKIYKPGARWARYAVKRISREIALQYCEDGVNFEKSIAYHRLVTELFLLSLISMEKLGVRPEQQSLDLMLRACNYTASYMRSDGLAPNIGDNDSAKVLAFDPTTVRNHKPLLALAATYFHSPELKFAAAEFSASIPWFFGDAGVDTWERMSSNLKCRNVNQWFQSGGMLTSADARHSLIADFGEVGQGGRGGHGHNDLFSFELCLDNQPVIVDSGSPVYTGDLQQKKLFRSTRAHNTISVDRAEMAPLVGPWRISNIASPRKVACEIAEDQVSIEGEHHGYARLRDPVVLRRRLTFNRRQGQVICTDECICNEAHSVEQILHFARQLSLCLKTDALEAYGGGRTFRVSWGKNASAKLELVNISDNYGQTQASQALVLRYEVNGATKMSFVIEASYSA